jgi:hypothetical protein
VDALLPTGFRGAVTESATGSARGNLLFSLKRFLKLYA